MNHAATRNVLVIANEAIDGQALRDVIREPHDSDVLVVAPALNTRLRHWMSDEDGARRRAAALLRTSVASLRASGVSVEGRVGDADPMQAIADALALFAADELVIAAQPVHRANRLARDIVSRAGARFALPVGHIVIDDRASSPAGGGLLSVRRSASAVG